MLIGILNKKLNYLIIFFLIILLPSFAIADDIHKSAGTQGAAFLKIPAGSRPVAMGGAFAGLADDANAIFWNPAGLTKTEKRELTAMHNFYLGDVNHETVGYAQRISKRAVIGLSFLGVFAEIEKRTAPTEDPDATFTASSMAIGGAVSYQFSSRFSLGVGGKFINENLDLQTTSGGAFDAGILYSGIAKRLSLGASAQNIGSLDTDADIPTNFKGGIAYRSTDGKFILAADVNLPVEGFITFHAGAESWFRDVLALRVGYNFGEGENPNRGIAAGVGLRAFGTSPLENVNFQFDYAFVPDKNVGDTHRIAFIARF